MSSHHFEKDRVTCRSTGGRSAAPRHLLFVITSENTLCRPNAQITGMGTPGAQIALEIGGLLLSAFVDVFGQWSIPLPESLIPGDYLAEAREETCQGRVTARAAQQLFLLEPPAPPAVTAPLPGSTVGTSVPLFSGTGEVGLAIRLQIGGAFYETTVGPGGLWSLQVTEPLPGGTYEYRLVTLGPGGCPSQEAAGVVTLAPPLDLTFTSLEMGQSFRTLSAGVLITAQTPYPDGTLYYLALPPDSPTPTAQEVISYGVEATLISGTAARGAFPQTILQGSTPISQILLGRQGAEVLPLEAGLVDGYRYRVYALLVAGDGTQTAVSQSPLAALAMPFAGGTGAVGDPFSLVELTAAQLNGYPDLVFGHPANRAGVDETARMLDNIEGLQVLFDETEGLYGLADSLARPYVMLGDFDLSGYATAYGGSGWRPIGNVNLYPGHIFTGSLTAPPPGAVITGLYQNTAAAPCHPVYVLGLFGQTKNAYLSSLQLRQVYLNAVLATGPQNAVGALVGFAQSTMLQGISVSDFTVSVNDVNCLGTVYVGGLAGLFVDSSLSGVLVTEGTVTASCAPARIVGGIVGGLFSVEAAVIFVNNRASALTVLGFHVGGLMGKAITGGEPLSITSCEATLVTVQGVSHVGGFAGELCSGGGELGGLLVDLCQSLGSVTGDRRVGGFVGIATGAELRGILANVAVRSQGECCGSDVCSLGGFGGELQNVRLSNCQALGSVTAPTGSQIGGFGGIVCSGETPGTTLLALCAAQGDVSGCRNVGGFCGGAEDRFEIVDLTFQSCSATGAVSASGKNAGGFLGSGAGVSCTACVAAGSTSAGDCNAGGFVGLAFDREIQGPSGRRNAFRNCYATGSVVAGRFAGGFGGHLLVSLCDQCFALGNVVAAGSGAGGFAAVISHFTLITDSYAAGTVRSKSETGGFVAMVQGAAQVTRSYASGSVQGKSSTGGFGDNILMETQVAISNSLVLSSLVASLEGPVRRFVQQSEPGNLRENYALASTVVLRDGLPQAIFPDPNGPDGGTVPIEALGSFLGLLGWDLGTVWNAATIATLGRPTLFQTAEPT